MPNKPSFRTSITPAMLACLVGVHATASPLAESAQANCHMGPSDAWRVVGAPALEFENAPVGIRSRLPVTIILVNLKNTPYSLSPPKLIGEAAVDFDVDSDCNAVRPHGSCLVTAHFKPKSPGFKKVMLDIQEVNQFQLTGQGYEPTPSVSSPPKVRTKQPCL